MKHILVAGVAVFAAFMGVTNAMAEAVPAYPMPGRAEDMGKGIQRTMSLLATSTPQKHNRVKILVYGQSISEQKWWELLKADLCKRFPNADLDIQNKAIGGFASQMLINPLQHDVYTFYPDLVIFHVYGADGEYRKIIEGIRSHTAAEVLIQKDHVGAKWPDPNADEKTNKGMWWDQYMNGKVLPAAAEKYSCGIIDIRTAWVKYLKDNNLQPKALLRDDVHLNDDGCALMAGLISQYLVYRPELPQDASLCRDIPVPAEMWKGGELTVPLEGNRVDLVCAAGTGAGDILIDGKKPSEYPGCYMYSRSSPGPWSPMFLARVDHQSDLVVEDWTLTVTKVSDDGKSFEYDVNGSKTGADGQGVSNARFRSTSGRVVIEPSWFFKGKGELTAGYKMTWRVLSMFSDTYAAPTKIDASRESVLTVAQGLPKGPHTLTIKGKTDRSVPLAAIRVYRPAF